MNTISISINPDEYHSIIPILINRIRQNDKKQNISLGRHLLVELGRSSLNPGPIIEKLKKFIQNVLNAERSDGQSIIRNTLNYVERVVHKVIL